MVVVYSPHIGMFSNTVGVSVGREGQSLQSIATITTYGKIMSCVMRCFRFQLEKRIIGNKEHYAPPTVWAQLDEQIRQRNAPASSSSGSRSNRSSSGSGFAASTPPV